MTLVTSARPSVAACLWGARGCGLHLQKPLYANWVAALPRAWSAQQLARGLRGRHTGGCLSSEGGADLPRSLRLPGAIWGLFCPTPSGSLGIPHKTEQAAIKWCPKMMVSRAGDHLRRGIIPREGGAGTGPVSEALGAKTLCVSQRKRSPCQCFVSMTCQWTCKGL